MIHLIVGNTGAGKTTYSNALKVKTKAVVFSIDQWNKTLFLADKEPKDGLDWFLERIERAEAMIKDLVKQLEAAGTDSILDLGFSRFDHREKFREFAERHGFDITLHFLDIPKEVRLARVFERNEQRGPTFQFAVSRADFDFMEAWFESPTAVELKNSVKINR